MKNLHSCRKMADNGDSFTLFEHISVVENSGEEMFRGRPEDDVPYSASTNLC